MASRAERAHGLIEWLSGAMAISALLFEPRDAASLAITRIVLGALLLLDLVYERGLLRASQLWDDGDGGPRCRFPVPGLDLKLGLAAAYAMYASMAIALFGFILGYRYRMCAVTYALLYWAMLVQDRSRWNNHSYLFGLLALLFATNDAHAEWSLDRPPATVVPYWQYFLIRFQVFLVYFYAGLKKTNPEWLRGYSMAHLSQLPVWAPARWLGVPPYWIDYYLIHLGGFLFDTSVGFLLLWPPTRPVAMLLCAAFNLINSQMFRIGMFPWVMIALTPIFCRTDWPRRMFRWRRHRSSPELRPKPIQGNRTVLVLVVAYVLFQVTVPFTFVALPGLNTWTAGAYGYNWDMMVHNWNHVHSQVRVQATVPTDNRTVELFLNPRAWTINHRWAHHADMVHQFALCVRRQLHRQFGYRNAKIYLEVWASLNGRFAQRIYDPAVDLARAPWLPWKPTGWVLPLLPRNQHWRRKLYDHFGQFDGRIRDHLANGSPAIFLADRAGGQPLRIHTGRQPGLRRLLVFDGTIRMRTDNGHHFIVAANRSTHLTANILAQIEPINGEAYFALLLQP